MSGGPNPPLTTWGAFTPQLSQQQPGKTNRNANLDGEARGRESLSSNTPAHQTLSIFSVGQGPPLPPRHATVVTADTDILDGRSVNVSRLKQTVTTSAVLAGFAMVALVELNFEDGLPEAVLIVYAITTAMLVCINIFSLLVSVCLLPTLKAFNDFCKRNEERGIAVLVAPELSPHWRFRRYMGTAWVVATNLGAVMMLADVILVAWARFFMDFKVAAYAVTALVAPLMVLFVVFSVRFNWHVTELHTAMYLEALGSCPQRPYE